jgi:hypothetical protein
VVAIKKDGTDEIVWSYHIWVTGYDPKASDATYPNPYNRNNNGKRFVFMDRNLGAKEEGQTYLDNDANNNAGLYYQWGRKDPFPSTGDPNPNDPSYPVSQAVGSFNAEETDGTHGSYWSAASSDEDASHLYFYNGAVEVASVGSRAYGVSVRCVRE